MDGQVTLWVMQVPIFHKEQKKKKEKKHGIKKDNISGSTASILILSFLTVHRDSNSGSVE